LSSEPHIYYEESDLSVVEGGVLLPLEGKYLAIRRMLEETRQLADLVDETARTDRPCLAMADGTLIQWPITREATGFSGQALDTFLAAMDRIKARECAIAGYISSPGGSSVIATLRAALCPAGFLDGARCPCVAGGSPGSNSVDPPAHGPMSATGPVANESSSSAGSREADSTCRLLAKASDARLFTSILQPGERSAGFESTSLVLQRYGEHRICFFYLNVGREVSRIEIPLWVASSPTLLDLTHSIAMDQAIKGMGYPVVLSEAHEHAVVQASDRLLFYQMVEKAFVRRGLPVELSLKSISKRQPLV
jgi:hypothetical protein